MNPVEFSDLVVDVEDSAGEGLQGELGRDHRVSIADRVRPPGRTGTQALHAGEVADLVTHFLRCGNDGVVELLQGRAAALDCRLSRCSQHPQGFHAAGTVFGHLDPASCARRLGRGDRIQGVVLALGSSVAWVRPGHLEHGDTRECQVPGDAGIRRYRWIPLLHEAARHESRTSEASPGSRLGWWRTHSVPSTVPSWLTTAAVCRSWWVSTPPMIWVVGCLHGRHVRPLVYDGWRGWLHSADGHDSDGAPKAGLSSGHAGRGRNLNRLPPAWPTCPGNDISVVCGSSPPGSAFTQSRSDRMHDPERDIRDIPVPTRTLVRQRAQDAGRCFSLSPN